MSRRPDLGFELPDDLPLLIGRQEEIGDLTRLVERCRLVTLTGPSGIGKTRVAIEVARRIQQSHPSRAALVELGAVADSDLVTQSVAAALGLEAQPRRDFLETLVAEMSSLSILLVLDNCEHVPQAAAELVDRLLAECDGVSVLATSQVALGVSGEQVRQLQPLSVPEKATSPDRALAESDAVALFCARAAAVRHDFALTDATLPAVVEICRRLEGIPLAIELAAARAAVLGPGDIAARLDHRFRVLSEGGRECPPRHRTLRAAIDWSYGLLGEPEATLLRRLSVFTGGASISAIGEVCGGDGISVHEVGQLVHALVARSLVTAGETNGQPQRYRLAETIRAYAVERLEEAGEAPSVRARHARWCAERAELLAGRDENEEDWASELEIDHDNLRAALAWSVEADVMVALRLAVALIGFWQSRAYFEEGQRWLTCVLEATAKAGSDVVIPAAPRAEALWGLGMVAMVRGDMKTARSAGQRALSLARKSDLASAETRAQNLLAFISVLTQDAITAKPVLEAAVARARSSRDAVALTGSLAMLGRAHLFLGEIQRSREVFEELLSVGGGHSAAEATFGLARAALAAGHEVLAQERLEAVLPRLQAVGDPLLVTLGLSYLGELAWARGDLGAARALLEEGLREAEVMGAPYPTARCLCFSALVTWWEGDLGAAMRQIDRACRVAAAARLKFALVRCLHVRGCLKQADGDLEGARDDQEEALTTSAGIGDRQGEATSMRLLAGVLRLFGDDDEAIRLVQQAISIEAEIGGGGLPSALEALGALRVDQSQPSLGAPLFGAAEAIRNSGGPARRPNELAGYHADLVDLRAGLGPDELERLWAWGAGLSPGDAVALALTGSAPEEPTVEELWATLTRAERRIVGMVAEGMSSRAIGVELGISERTVQGHVGRALGKLHLTSRRQLKSFQASRGEDDSGR